MTKYPTKPAISAQIAPDNFRHSLIDSKVTPIDSVITNIAGMDWTVDYYSQVLGLHEEPKEFQESDTAHQQYLKIEKYNLKLQGDFSRSWDDNTNMLNMSGSAILYPKLIPNKGDVILADIGDGRLGYFIVTNTAQKSMFSNRAYEIDFVLKGYMNDHLFSILEHRVVKHARFIKDYIQYGQDPVLVEEEHSRHIVIEDAISDVLGSWLSEFYSHEINTIRVPTGGCSFVYDPFVTALILKLFTPHDHPLVGQISTYNTDARTLSSHTDIWSAILSREEWMLFQCFVRYGLVSTEKFVHNVHLRNIRHSRIDFVVMPSIEDDGINDPLDVSKHGGRGMGFDISYTDELKDLLIREGIEPPCMVCCSYVVSQHVYKLDREPVSPLEQELRNYFQEEAVNVEVILKYVTNRRMFTKLQRFYIMPLCLLMLIHVQRAR